MTKTELKLLDAVVLLYVFGRINSVGIDSIIG